MDEYVTVVDEDGVKQKMTLDDALMDWLEQYDWDDCVEILEEYIQLHDLQRAIRDAMTNEQKYQFLEKRTEENIDYL